MADARQSAINTAPFIMGPCLRCLRWNRSPDSSPRGGGHAIERIDLLAFSALKTFDPPLSALARSDRDVTRHGKFLDIAARPPPGAPPRPGRLGALA